MGGEKQEKNSGTLRRHEEREKEGSLVQANKRSESSPDRGRGEKLHNCGRDLWTKQSENPCRGHFCFGLVTRGSREGGEGEEVYWKNDSHAGECE